MQNSTSEYRIWTMQMLHFVVPADLPAILDTVTQKVLVRRRLMWPLNLIWSLEEVCLCLHSGFLNWAQTSPRFQKERPDHKPCNGTLYIIICEEVYRIMHCRFFLTIRLGIKQSWQLSPVLPSISLVGLEYRNCEKVVWYGFFEINTGKIVRTWESRTQQCRLGGVLREILW